ncbi:MAG: hypothetical protein QXZ56_02040 [Sulfolobales archaeon]
MNIKEVFNIVDEVVLPKGNVRPGFTSYHVYLTLNECAKTPLGRKTLSNILGIGEGSVRTLVRRLYNVGLIAVDPVAGVLLTEKGFEVLELLKNNVLMVGSFDFSDIELCRDCRISVVLLKNGVKLVEEVGGVLYVRDLIVKKGGVGGLILYYIEGSFKLPDSYGLYEITNQEFWKNMLSSFKVVDGDCVLASICRRGDMNCLMYVVEAALDVLRGALR